MLTPDAQVGDFVLLHTGFAISVIDEQEALETLRLIEDISAFDEAS
jgi:hydrogenase expression/formation protein HypC